jgi:hypothetical protein
MTLSEVFDYLSIGELAQLNIGTGNNGQISEDKYPLFIKYMQLSLSKLYARFPLRYEEIIVEQITGRTSYPLLSKHALSKDSADGTDIFIMDSVSNPFLDNIIQLETITDEFGEEILLNNSVSDKSLFTTDYRTLLIPEDFNDGATLSIVFRADHPKINTSGIIDAENTEVFLPQVLLEPLLTSVTIRALNSMTSAETKQLAMQKEAELEMQLVEIESKNLIRREEFTNIRFWSNGWV